MLIKSAGWDSNPRDFGLQPNAVAAVPPAHNYTPTTLLLNIWRDKDINIVQITFLTS